MTPRTIRCTACRRAGCSTATTTTTVFCPCTCSAATDCWRRTCDRTRATAPDTPGRFLALLTKRLRQAWPKVKIVFRSDSGFCRRMLSWCEREGVDYIVSIARNAALAKKAKLVVELAAMAHELPRLVAEPISAAAIGRGLCAARSNLAGCPRRRRTLQRLCRYDPAEVAEVRRHRAEQYPAGTVAAVQLVSPPGAVPHRRGPVQTRIWALRSESASRTSRARGVDSPRIRRTVRFFEKAPRKHAGNSAACTGHCRIRLFGDR